VTFYRTTEELPDFTDYAMKGRTYRYMEQEALYPFGFGKSYTTFEVGGIKADGHTIAKGGQISMDVTVKNTGSYAGGETVQVYVKALRDNTPNAQLKGLKKVYLQPGEEKTVTVVLTDAAFGLYDEDGKFVLEAGEYAVYAGCQQPDARSAALTGKVCETIAVSCKETAVV